MTKATPIQIRDLRKGRMTTYAVNDFLIPGNSVSECQNFLFDEIVGSAIVRKGTQVLGGSVSSGNTCLGTYDYVSGNTFNRIVAVYRGTTNATLYSYGGTWTATSLNTLTNTSRVRFANLGNYLFLVNGTQPMQSSTDTTTWGTTNCFPTSVGNPSLVIRAKERLLVAGIQSYPDRIYFSSIVDMTTNPFITWNTNSVTGDWIDVNPDDGDNITAWEQTSNQVIVFKKRAMYRLNVIAKAVDVENIFNVGATKQEAVTRCQGQIYFFSGRDIRRTDGGYPEQISRLAVQDIIDSIPLTQWDDVHVFSDEYNVYVSCGDVTVGEKIYRNCVLKFSTRDESWSIHSYGNKFEYGVQFAVGSSMKLCASDTSGNIQMLNTGNDDNGKEIFYSLETQNIECGNLAHKKVISDKMVVFMIDGASTSLYYSIDNGDWKRIPEQMKERVTIVPSLNINGFREVRFRIQGNTKTMRPVFEGLQIENIDDQGII